jgi:hypothetical protein
MAPEVVDTRTATNPGGRMLASMSQPIARVGIDQVKLAASRAAGLARILS